MTVHLKPRPAPENLPKGWTFLGDVFKGDKCLGVLFVDDKDNLCYHVEGFLYKNKCATYTIPRGDLNIHIAPRIPKG